MIKHTLKAVIDTHQVCLKNKKAKSSCSKLYLLQNLLQGFCSETQYLHWFPYLGKML